MKPDQRVTTNQESVYNVIESGRLEIDFKTKLLEGLKDYQFQSFRHAGGGSTEVIKAQGQTIGVIITSYHLPHGRLDLTFIDLRAVCNLEYEPT